MANAETLSDDDITEKLEETQIWSRSDNKLVTRVEFDNYKDSVFFANTVFTLAEAHFHHPEVTVEYGAVEIDLWSHEEDGITEADFALAEEIEQRLGEIKWS
ncbi:4a-hydroxytetrahydrobiopterin dehydratase [Candidatus Nanohalobium constans]|uniref:4a-hydroxytetrahydrobiopterin dehydratase n=1 Tax=Candidatus Nanohalobium constans TaxID=2565781 RepID=A0A5Q0UGM1_9ARCH|nr:4a-hydroxytetrahydrobiopterin dehydratase [Candidatus Nanohalobium constans]QGA80744.1 4a-hydroxytetrahydrobiopterin dehydratase [Candidatus Nanohalobium constans]